MRKYLISGSFIIEPLREFLDFWVQEIPLTCEIKFAPYNQIFQTLLNSSADNDAIFIVIRDKDLQFSSYEENFYFFVQHLRNICKTISASIFVIHCPERTPSLWGDHLKKEIDSISGAYYIELHEWLDKYQVSNYFDVRTEKSAHIPYTLSGYAVLGTLIARIIYSMQFPLIKLIGVDCDNTLWKGIVAEEPIVIHSEFQQWLVNLYQRGIAIALFSKNELEDVVAVFENHTDMILKKDFVTAWHINWNSKGENLVHLINKLNIGPDSVLFFDDNPIECATVSASISDVVVVQFDPSIFHHVWDIPIYHKMTLKDAQRTNMYKKHLEREELKSSSKSLSDFINSLHLNTKIKLIDADEIERVAQLTQRTNQFNASNRRRKAQQIREFLKVQRQSIYVIYAEDRFGDYGLVGAIFIKHREDDLILDTFLLSCRVLGRGIEHQMMSFIGQIAHRKLVVVNFCQTKRNTPVKIFLESLKPLTTDENGYFFESKQLIKIIFEPDKAVSSESLVSDIKPAKSTLVDRSNFVKLTTTLKTAEELQKRIRKDSGDIQLDKSLNTLESTIVKCISDVLNIENIDVNDHFFASLGGDSFDAAVLASRLEEATNKSVDIIHIFDTPTAKNLAILIQQLPYAVSLPENNKDIKDIPATGEQLAIWYGMQVATQPTIYHIELSYSIHGDLDIERLKSCFDSLKNRYDALKSPFTLIHNNFIQTKNELYFYKLTQELSQQWRLDVMFHHIICDEQSIALFMQELSDLYKNPQKKLTPAGSYAQYSFNQQKEIPLHTLLFWKNELPQTTPSLTPNRDAGHYSIPISPHIREKIQDLSKKFETTPFALLLSVFSLSYKLFSQEDRFLIGIPFSTRKAEKTFGLFVNLLPMKFSFQNESRFTHLLKVCKEKLAEMFYHRLTPFFQIQEALGTRIHLNVIFSWNRRIDQTPQINGTEVQRLEKPSPFTEFDLSFVIEEEENRYRISIQYASGIYESWRINTLANKFMDILEKILVQPELLIKDLGSSLNQTESNFALGEQPTLVEMIEGIDPNLIAIENENLSLTYRALNEKVNQLAHYFIRKGMSPGKGSVVCFENPVSQIIATLAVLKTGGYFIPLDSRDPIEHRKSIIEDVKPFLIIDHITFDKLDSLPSTNPEVRISPNDIAYVIYTSGSTGRPKGVIIEHEGISHRAIHAKQMFHISSTTKMLSHISPAFDMHISEWAFSLANGATLCPYKGGINRLWNFMNVMQVSHAQFTPGVLNLLPKVPLDHLKFLLIGGEATPQSLIEYWSKQVKLLLNGYGPTECTIFTHLHAFNTNQSARIIGRPISGIECSVIDDQGNPVQEGGIGELHLKGIGVARGYIRGESFSNCQYRTGDFVRVLPDGMLEYVGRKNDFVKVNGSRVDIHLVESKIMSAPNIPEAAVGYVSVNNNRSALACYYAGSVDNWKIIRHFLRKQLPSYMVPTQYIHLEKLPRLSNGKLDRKSLHSIKTRDHKNCSISLNITETKLQEIWEKLLGECPKDRTNDFFQMGGDSLQSVQLIIEIEKAWGIEVTMSELQEHSTISELAQFMESHQANPKRQTVIPIQTTGNRFPIFMIHPSVGLAECYRPLAECLPDHPIYGIQNPFITQKTTSFSSLSEMAIYYSQEIRKIQSKTPCIIGGWSFGGIVALEVAKILKETGELIDRVIMLDSYAPDAPVTDLPVLIYSEDLQAESQHNYKLLKNHQSSYYDGMVHLVRAGDSVMPDNGWDFLPNLSISKIPMAHHEMFEHQHISTIAKAIQLSLASSKSFRMS